MLEQHTGVFVKVDESDETVLFDHLQSDDADDPGYSDVEKVTLSRNYWEEMGIPEMLTVTFVPGNTLNNPSADDETEYTDPMLLKVEILPSQDGQFYLRGTAANGEPLWMSETYRDIDSARNHAYSYRVQVQDDSGHSEPVEEEETDNV